MARAWPWRLVCVPALVQDSSIHMGDWAEKGNVWNLGEHHPLGWWDPLVSTCPVLGLCWSLTLWLLPSVTLQGGWW